MDREKERRLKNATEYILAVLVFIFVSAALYFNRISGQHWIISLLISFVIFSESDITDLAELYIKRGQ